jgi:hypothetical protein
MVVSTFRAIVTSSSGLGRGLDLARAFGRARVAGLAAAADADRSDAGGVSLGPPRTFRSSDPAARPAIFAGASDSRPADEMKLVFIE